MEEIGDKRGLAIIYSYIGILYEWQGDYEGSLKNHEASLRLCEEIGFKEGIAAAYGNSGNIYEVMGNYPEALKNYLAA